MSNKQASASCVIYTSEGKHVHVLGASRSTVDERRRWRSRSSYLRRTPPGERRVGTCSRALEYELQQQNESECWSRLLVVAASDEGGGSGTCGCRGGAAFDAAVLPDRPHHQDDKADAEAVAELSPIEHQHTHTRIDTSRTRTHGWPPQQIND